MVDSSEPPKSSSSKRAVLDALLRKDALGNLLRSCSSIANAARSCPTMGRRRMAATTPDGGRCRLSSDRGGGRRKRRRSSRTSVDGERGGVDNGRGGNWDFTLAYAQEVRVGQWLESQITDYRAALGRRSRPRSTSHLPTTVRDSSSADSSRDTTELSKRPRTDDDDDGGALSSRCDRGQRRQGTAATTAADRKAAELELRALQNELFDETVRALQERLLLSRLRMSAAAVYTVFPDAAPPSADNEGSDCDGDVDDNTRERERQERYLLREALRSRDDAVIAALGKLRDADSIRKRLDTASDVCRSWQRKNRKLWKELLYPPGKVEKGAGDEVGGEGINLIRDRKFETSSQHNAHLQRLRDETTILKRALSDIIVSGGLDWYANARLHRTMAKLED